MAIRWQWGIDITQRPAGLIFNNTIPVVVRRFGQWTMELGYQPISSCQAGRYYPTYYVMVGGSGNGEWRRISCTSFQGALASSNDHLGSVFAPSPAME